MRYFTLLLVLVFSLTLVGCGGGGGGSGASVATVDTSTDINPTDPNPTDPNPTDPNPTDPNPTDPNPEGYVGPPPEFVSITGLFQTSPYRASLRVEHQENSSGTLVMRVNDGTRDYYYEWEYTQGAGTYIPYRTIEPGSDVYEVYYGEDHWLRPRNSHKDVTVRISTGNYVIVEGILNLDELNATEDDTWTELLPLSYNG